MFDEFCDRFNDFTTAATVLVCSSVLIISTATVLGWLLHG